MAKGKKLTDRERGQIEALSSTGMSSRAIAIKIGRSKTVVNNFFKWKDNYGKKNTGGRPKALSSRDERRVCQLASTGKYSTRKLIPKKDLKFTFNCAKYKVIAVLKSQYRFRNNHQEALIIANIYS
ncbi:Transposable element Tc3 transposase like protein [Argiope bruennichi]|uniref:Transposable element Tc3 transposase like protein n=1 Tax=Argiope bruennichi TaxID=94029 RepID=A0A8T0G2S9_ARGBR|nr:Transposable element Tc3 transposase like protein [Argiope bruennichi]